MPYVAPPRPAPAPSPDDYGWPRGLWRALAARRPPGLPTPGRWRSPLRGPWLTAVFGAVLLFGMPIVIITGLLSYIAYAPQFGQAIPGDVGWLRLPLFDWPTSPSWLYRLTQGLHVGLGLTLIPIVLAKLWSVIPKLFTWPPVRSFAQLVERISILLLVGSVLFELVTGVLNIQYDYLFGFSFYTGHYYGAWVFIASFVVHVGVKSPTMVRSLRARPLRRELRNGIAATVAETGDSDLIPTHPAPATVSRRGALAVVGGGAALVALFGVGDTVGGWWRDASILSPRSKGQSDGPNGFQINRTAQTARITGSDVGSRWRLVLMGGGQPVEVSREQLLAMPRHSASLPIACVEGWSTTQQWSGVRLLDLARLAGVADPASAEVTSLERGGPYSKATLQANQIADRDSMLALIVNDVDLSLDHGYPARVIVPALPGVHNTKWVHTIEFTAGR